MKDFMRGRVELWNCRAGENSLGIRADGSLDPCFPMYPATYEWGTFENQKFEAAQLDRMKESCQKPCFSNLNHSRGYGYSNAGVIRWVLKQARCASQGLTGSFG